MSMWAGGGAYNAWVSFLDRWAAGERVDPGTLPPLLAEAFDGDGWERIVNRLTDAVSRRMQLWADALSRAIGDARDEFSVARALVQARDGLRAVRVLTTHPGLPKDISAALLQLVDQQVRSMQQSLEEQVERLRRAGAPARQVEARLRTIRDNTLTVVTTENTGPQGTAPAPAAWASDPTAPRKRHVIVD
jgi:hypothetical protein